MALKKTKNTAARGFVNNIILESLLHGDKYGYEIIKEVDEKTDGKIQLKQPSLYSSLKRFETKGYITSYWGDSDIGGRRHYYSITQVGRDYFDTIQNEETFESLSELVEKVNEPTNISIEEIMPVEEKPAADSKLVAHEEKNEIQQEVAEAKVEQINPDSEDYDVFALLSKNDKPKPVVDQPDDLATTQSNETPEQSANKSSEVKAQTAADSAIQFDMFNSHEPTAENHGEQRVDKQEIKQTKATQTSDDEQPEDVGEAKSKTTPPLIKERGQEFFNWEDLKRKIVAQSNDSAENNLQNHAASEAIEEAEKSVEVALKPKKEVKIIVDEFGIFKSSQDQLNARTKHLVDNVGVRLEVNDPLINLKSRKKDKEKEIKFDIETKPVAEFNEQQRVISEKLDRAVQTQKTKSTSFDLKNIMGEIMVDDDYSAPAKQMSEDLHEEVSDDIFQDVHEYNPAEYKATSYAALIDNLTNKGYKFKPFDYEIDEPKTTNSFALVNKIKLHFGLAMFLILTLQITAFFIALQSVGYVFKNIDYVLVGLSYFVSLMVALVCLVPYLLNAKKRKINKFNLGQALLLGTLTALSLTVITFAINTFLGLSTNNITDYFVTLFLPILMLLGFVVGPLIYNIFLSNKKYY